MNLLSVRSHSKPFILNQVVNIAYFSGFNELPRCGVTGHPGGFYKEVGYMFNTSHLRLKPKTILNESQAASYFSKL